MSFELLPRHSLIWVGPEAILQKLFGHPVVGVHVLAEDAGNCAADQVVSRIVGQCFGNMPEENLMEEHANIPHLRSLIVRLLHYDFGDHKIFVLFLKRRVGYFQGKS